nr:PREDICTED: MAX gene-associated protein isoform X1 [Latimeria chalumnae]XP_006008528.1 PREDICTED: MAX gene-associated protein isoform X1 [Latimeria chalumnae]|eukprot:XP_006008527.1 PREDICTED: MAX gene-associated protein isoform X1 [Latimeria chalumnae]
MKKLKPRPSMEKPVMLLKQDCNPAPGPGTPAAFFVILKQAPGNGDTEQGILVANHDIHGIAATGSRSEIRPKGKVVQGCLSAECCSGDIKVTLDNNGMWNEFYHCRTEMILTKQGRRMFPYCRYRIGGLDPFLKYILVMDITPVDNSRYKWNGRRWEASGKAEPHVLGRVFIHPESPSTGHYWMQQPISFYKLKLTNNTLDQEGHIILHSMHRYLPRLHIVPADKATEVIQLNGPDVLTFTFPQTEFFAVTAYQNLQITQLKIDYNPFAKGFREDGPNCRPRSDVRPKSYPDQLDGANLVETHPLKSFHSKLSKLVSSGAASTRRSSGKAVSDADSSLDLDFDDHSFNAERDFLGFLNEDFPSEELPGSKPKAASASHVTAGTPETTVSPGSSAVRPGDYNIVIKEEPLDDYEYGAASAAPGVTVKEEYLEENCFSDDEPILEKQLKKQAESDAKPGSCKRLLSSPSGVAKAKLLKLESGKMPVVYLEPCSVTKRTVKISELPQNLLSPCKKDPSPAKIAQSSSCGLSEKRTGTPNTSPEKLKPDDKDAALVRKGQPKQTSVKVTAKESRVAEESSVLCPVDLCSRDTEGPLRKDSGQVKLKSTHSVSERSAVETQDLDPSLPKRGRPRKVKISKAGRPPRKGKLSQSNVPQSSPVPDMKPDLENIDGVLFVAFASKQALDVHAADLLTGSDSQALRDPSQAASKMDCWDNDQEKIKFLEKELVQDLKFLKYKQAIHPVLQEVGLKLNFVDPTLSIDLKYLGVQLPLPPPIVCSTWNHTDLAALQGSQGSGVPFVSRTGKTNDLTKIKGWKAKFPVNAGASSSRTEGSGSLEGTGSGSSEGTLKNRSAFWSDKLDEYLENEAKLLEHRSSFSSSTATPPVVYQMPTKSSSYVRTLDSVLKKQSHVAPFQSRCQKKKKLGSKTSPASRKKLKVSNPKNRYRSKPRPPIAPKPPATPAEPPIITLRPTASVGSAERANNFVMPILDECLLPKSLGCRLQQLPLRPAGLSKAQVKLMDLEDNALWDGKPRNYITEERADISLSTLLTAQGSLKAKPVHKVIKKRAPPCNNDFCRLGCVCASLAQEKRQATHCRKPDCMFGCSCLKRKMLLVKCKRMQRSPSREDLIFYDALGEDEEEEDGDNSNEEEDAKLKYRQKRRRVEYAISDPEPEEPVRHYPLWVKEEGEVDPEPIFIPTPSVIEPFRTYSPSADMQTSSKSKSFTGVKPVRVYTPKPNPVIRDEDKDPVYLYFESMMTCARVRVYERRIYEQQDVMCTCNSRHCSGKENDPAHRLVKGTSWSKSTSKTLGAAKSFKPCSSEDRTAGPSSSVSQPPSDGPTKLIEIISDCNWEGDRNKILSILSRHINSNSSIPQSLKVGSFIIELVSECEKRGENNTPIYTSKVKISMPSSQGERKEARPSCTTWPLIAPKPPESPKLTRVEIFGKLKEKLPGGKALPFYSGITPAGILKAHKRRSNIPPTGLIQVNGKSYPQAKLLLGQMGALHPANRLAAYITGRLRPTVLDLSSLSTVISKSSRTATGTKEATVTTNARMKPTTIAIAPAVSPVARVQKQPGGMFMQFVLNKVGALRQKLPGVTSCQPAVGSQKFTIKPSPLMVVTPVVPSRPSGTTSSEEAASATSVAPASDPAVATVVSPGGSAGAALDPQEGGQTLVKAVVAASPLLSPSVSLVSPVSGSSTTAATTTATATTSSPAAVSVATTSTVTASTSSAVPVAFVAPTPRPEGTVAQILPSTSSPQPVPAVSEKRVGPRLLLIPVHSGSPALRPLQTTQFSAGQKMVLQPLRGSGGVNLFRHPNGQIIQLVPIHQLRPTGTHANLQHVVFRSPGSVSTLRLPVPAHSTGEVLTSPTAATSLSLSPVGATTTTVIGPTLAPTSGTATPSPQVAATPSFVARPGTLTLRISPPLGSSTTPRQGVQEHKVLSCNSPGQAVGSASLIPLQSGGFALLQVPGQKSPFVNHAAMLQVVKEAQAVLQKTSVPADPSKEDEPSKPEEVVVAEPEVTVTESSNEADDSTTKQPAEVTLSAESAKCREEVAVPSPPSEAGSEADDDGASQKSVQQESTPAHIVSNDHSYTSGRPVCLDQSAEVSGGRSCSASFAAEPDETSKDSSESLEQASESGSSAHESVCDGNIKKSGPDTEDIKIIAGNSRQGNRLCSLNTKGGCNPKAAEKGLVRQSLGPSSFVVKGNASRASVPAEVPTSPRLYGTERSFPSSSTIDITIEDDEDEFDDEEEKTDDSADEPMEDIQSEEDVDVEKLDDSDSSEDEEEEQVDIETVEELSEKINIARLKATASRLKRTKPQCHVHNPNLEKEVDRVSKGSCCRRLQGEGEDFDHYRQTHTANERRRRNEMRDLFEQLKRTLGLHILPKVSKYHILKQAFNEIEGLTDHADRLIGQKNMLTRKRDLLIRKVSVLSGKHRGKTEEVVLKKLEYICAKQKAVEAQKKKQGLEHETVEKKQSFKSHRSIESSILESGEAVESEGLVTGNRGVKPLILSRKRRLIAPKEAQLMASNTTVPGSSLRLAQQGPVLALKTPVVPGQAAAVIQADGKPQVLSADTSAASGIASVVIQLPSGTSIPIQVKNLISGSLKGTGLPFTLASSSQGITSITAAPVTEPSAPPAESEDSFMMPKIINVTSLAGEGATLQLDGDIGGGSHPLPPPSALLTGSDKQKGSKADLHCQLREGSGLPGDSAEEDSGDNLVAELEKLKADAAALQELEESSLPHVLNVSSVQGDSESSPEKLSEGERSAAKEGGLAFGRKEQPAGKLQTREEMRLTADREQLRVEAKGLLQLDEVSMDTSELLAASSEGDNREETLMSLLNEIAFLNQQLNSDSSSLSTLPDHLGPDFSSGGFRSQRGSGDEIDMEPMDDTNPLQFGDLGEGLKGMSVGRASSGGSLSPLLLQLEEEELEVGDRQASDTSAESDILKIVIGSNTADLVTDPGTAKEDADAKSVTSETGTLAVSSLPALHIKTNVGSSDAETGAPWKPMPRLAPLGLKAAGKPVPQQAGQKNEPQSPKPMPRLASAVSKDSSASSSPRTSEKDVQ